MSLCLGSALKLWLELAHALGLEFPRLRVMLDVAVRSRGKAMLRFVLGSRLCSYAVFCVR